MEVKEIEINVGEDLEVSDIREKENGVILTVKKKFIPKLGELCYCKLESRSEFIFTYGVLFHHSIYLDSRACYNSRTDYFSIAGFPIAYNKNDIVELRPATKEESELFFNKIPKGYTLDENGYVVRCFWRAKKEENYYFIDSYLTIAEDFEMNSLVDDNRYKVHNYFKTKEEARIKRDKIMKLLYENK